MNKSVLSLVTGIVLLVFVIATLSFGLVEGGWAVLAVFSLLLIAGTLSFLGFLPVIGQIIQFYAMTYIIETSFRELNLVMPYTASLLLYVPLIFSIYISLLTIVVLVSGKWKKN